MPLAFASAANAQVVNWVGPANGDWSDNANWSGGAFPNSTVVDANIGGAFDVIVGPGITRDVRNLSINAAGSLTISDNSFFDVNNGGLDNAGNINVISTGGNTQLRFFGVNNITGGGTIVLDGGIIGGSSGPVTNADNLITGTGNVGNNAIRFNNEGTVRAQGGTLVLDPATVVGGPEFFNTG
ncbi:MAG: hypothetical protein AAGK78_08975, partial [Planctomycetota bacterium]